MWKPGGACGGSGEMVVLKPCGSGGGAVLCKISSAEAERPFTRPCIQRLDC